MSEPTASIVSTLTDAGEGERVELHFQSQIEIPVARHNAPDEIKTLPHRTIRGEVERAELVDLKGTLDCLIRIGREEKTRLGLDPDAIPDGHEDWYVEILAKRESGEIGPEEAEAAIEAGNEDEVLPPWKGRPIAQMPVSEAVRAPPIGPTGPDSQPQPRQAPFL